MSSEIQLNAVVVSSNPYPDKGALSPPSIARCPSVSSTGTSGYGDNKSAVSERQEWGGQIEFFLTCLGFSVGLGNVWRFPYLAFDNGGGAFLIPYVVTLILVGMPLYFMELCMGQFGSLGPLSVWRISPLFKGLGFASITVSAYVVLYFNVIVSWCLYYVFASFSEVLPWTTCDNSWNTPACRQRNGSSLDNATIIGVKSPAEEYYYNHVLDMSDGIEDMGFPRWQLVLLLFLSWLIVFIVLIKGIQSLGKASYFISLFPYVLLTVMLVRGVTLEGAIDGIIYYIEPQWEKLADLKVWTTAASQIFYSTGVCMGSLIAMASYNKFNNNVMRDATIIPIINCLTSVYAGFVIFSVLGFMSRQSGVPVEEAAREGPGLVFVVYPEGLATMPLPQLWSVLFFTMMTLIGYSSQFSMSEGIIGTVMDEFPDTLRIGDRPLYFRAAFCGIMFVLGIPMLCEGGFYLFNIVDTYCAGYTLLTIGLMEVIVISWIYGYDRFAEDIALMLGRRPFIIYKYLWSFITPAIIIVVFVIKCIDEAVPTLFGYYRYPDWAYSLCWLIVAFPLSAIVFCFLHRYCRYGGWEVLHESLRPRTKWGPASDEKRTGMYAHEEIQRRLSLNSQDHPTKRRRAGSINSISSTSSFASLSTITKVPAIIDTRY